jgi:serine/threonine-protein kinase RsbW
MLVHSAARSAVSIVFAGTPESAPAARRLIRDLLAGCPRLDDCELVATELIANAIRHSASGNEGGTFLLTITAAADRIRLEVEDQGSTQEMHDWYHDAMRNAIPAQADAADDCGRGLALVQAIADETGNRLADDNGHVAWAELCWMSLPLFAGLHLLG